jgi:hypothetical protein
MISYIISKTQKYTYDTVILETFGVIPQYIVKVIIIIVPTGNLFYFYLKNKVQ